MRDYSDIGFSSNLRSLTSLSSKRQNPASGHVSALQQDLLIEKSPFMNTIVSKGTIQTTAGGVFDAKGSTGVSILDVDPVTNTTTITGTVIANQTSNLGTVSNSAIVGTTTLRGTVTNSGIIASGSYNNPVLGTPIMQGGSIIFGTLNSPQIVGVANFSANAGSGALPANGDFQLQNSGGSAQLTARYNGTTYRFLPDSAF